MLNNIADNLEQCGQQNIVQCCFYQARTGCSFFAVYFCVLFLFCPDQNLVFDREWSIETTVTASDWKKR